jgi:hypothetical protein
MRLKEQWYYIAGRVGFQVFMKRQYLQKGTADCYRKKSMESGGKSFAGDLLFLFSTYLWSGSFA